MHLCLIGATDIAIDADHASDQAFHIVDQAVDPLRRGSDFVAVLTRFGQADRQVAAPLGHGLDRTGGLVQA